MLNKPKKSLMVCLLLLSFSANANLKKDIAYSEGIPASNQELLSSSRNSQAYTVSLNAKVGTGSEDTHLFTDTSDVSKSVVVQDIKFDQHKLLRCWQDGKLIMAENGWNANSQQGKIIMSKGNQKMSVFEFGNTFCVYLGA